MKRRFFSVRRIALLAVLLSLALLIGFIEAILPPILPTLPFFKIGLSNVVILFSLLVLGYGNTAVLVCAKAFILPLYQANPIMFLYSFPSAVLSFSLSFLLIKFKKLGLPTVGFFSALIHNITQLVVAALITRSSAVFVYLPYLFVIGGISGVITGSIVTLLIKKLPETLLRQ